jgi:hypothetical protein
MSIGVYFRVWGLGLGFRVVFTLGFGVLDLGFRVQGSGFVFTLGFGV